MPNSTSQANNSAQQGNNSAQQAKYYRVAMSFIKLTTPVYIAFYAFLITLRYLGLDDFENRLIGYSFLHMFGLQAFHFIYLQQNKHTITKHYMQQLLWFLVINNGLLFAYWLAYLDEARPFIYIIASMSTVSLFSTANFKQSMYLNNAQVLSFAACVVLNEWLEKPESLLSNCAVDFVYLVVLWVVCTWLSLIADSHMRVKKERDQFMARLKSAAQNAANTALLNNSADTLSDSAQQLNHIAHEQQQLLAAVATTTDELRASSDANAGKSNQTLKAVEKSQHHIIDSLSDMQKLHQSINEVKRSGNEIKAINDLMNDIAYQTNILSLNAMIEASRASENSGGFQVVAHEVNNLAERASRAAADINKLLEKNSTFIDRGVELSDTVQSRFAVISEDITPVASAIKAVSEASREQSYAIAQVSDSVGQMHQSTEQNLSVAQETLSTAKELKINAAQLADVMHVLGK